MPLATDNHSGCINKAGQVIDTPTRSHCRSQGYEQVWVTLLEEGEGASGKETSSCLRAEPTSPPTWVHRSDLCLSPVPRYLEKRGGKDRQDVWAPPEEGVLVQTSWFPLHHGGGLSTPGHSGQVQDQGHPTASLLPRASVCPAVLSASWA